MGAMAAAFDKKGEDATFAVLTMLNELKHRATRNPTVVGQPLTYITQQLNDPEGNKTFSKTAVGSSSSEPILGENHLMVLEGRFFPPSASTIHSVMHQIARQPLKKASLILKELDGSYTFAIAFSDRILVGRDTLGTKPLYCGENESACAVATEQKALWKIRITNTRSFPPGNLAIMNKTGFTFEPISTLKPIPQMRIGMGEAAKRLQELLEKSTRERVSDIKNVGVAFSGGLDSSVVAFLAKRAGVNVNLVCVGLKGQSESDYAKEAADMLELPLAIHEYTNSDVESLLPRILWLIEEPDIMKASVAIPFYWTAEIAAKLGYDVLLAGQGADELFGGYQKYLREYEKGGTQKVREAIFRDMATSYETNFQRDEPVCAYHKVELRLPFADAEVARFALSLPIALKIKSPEDSLKKRVLRQTAKDLGIPTVIAYRPKKAIQFATGVGKALDKLAKKEGLTQHSYVDTVFKKVYPSLEVENE
jgi:asparagine synthase (glutamine-hydrolysing)